ncbi:MAG TPA: MmgE/PrpD family protein [Alphaproteobacteria bacterium]|nr:MmgE/PrpD family protein [Alphaproteobacteria bacterium]
MPTIAEILADFAVQIAREGDLALARRMEIYALDTLAVTLAGTVAPSSKPMTRMITAAFGKPEATVMAVGRITSAWDAALANGTFAHALELDDDHRIAVLHPGAVVVPAALAAAEAASASGLAFLRALLVGYEITCRLGEVFRGSQFYHGVHPTALCGVFGAAAAAGVAMGLDRDAMVRALGIAGTQASGLTEWRSDGSWIKRLHPGRAAQSGVLAARLAREGFTGPATIFEGPGGFLNAFSFGEPIEVERMTRGLGEEYSALGTAIKPYPCCRFAHGAIDLAIEAFEQGAKAPDIESVAVRLYRTDVLSYHRRPRNAVDAQFNVPYVVAVALLRGRIALKDFTDEAVSDEDVLALCERIEVSEDAGFTAEYPARYPTELVLRLRGSGERRFFNDCPSGDPEAPQYRADPRRLRREAERKVAALLAECGFADRVEPLKTCVAALVEAPGMGGLSSVLGAALRDEKIGAIAGARRRAGDVRP